MNIKVLYNNSNSRCGIGTKWSASLFVLCLKSLQFLQTLHKRGRFIIELSSQKFSSFRDVNKSCLYK